MDMQQVEQWMAEVAMADAAERKLTAQMDAELTKVREKYAAALEAEQRRRTLAEEELASWAGLNKEAFGAKRSLKLVHGVMGWRLGTPALKLRSRIKSDMAFDIEVTNCYVRVADIRITPSNPDETWLLMITPTSYLPDDYDNETLLDYALGEFIYYTYEFKGEITTHMNTLYPNTEYVIVVFGYSGGVVTTEVCSEVFKTEKEGECELEVTDVIVGDRKSVV